MENQLVQLGNLIIDVNQINYIEKLNGSESGSEDIKHKTVINTNHKNHYCTLSLEDIMDELLN